MNRWTATYRVASLALLVTIVLQLGGWEWLESGARRLAYAVKNIGTPTEEPAPARPAAQPGGIDAMFQESTDRALDDLVQRHQRPASAPR